MLSDEDIKSLPENDPTASDFGLNENDAGTIWSLKDPIIPSSGSFPAQASGHLIAWGAWLWLCIYYWNLSTPIIIIACLFGMIVPLAVAMGLIGIFNRIHLRFISQEKIQAYEDWRQAKKSNEEQYKKAYEVMGLDVSSKCLRQWGNADRITQSYSNLFHVTEISEAQFIGAHRLPCKLEEMERFFKFEIFLNIWIGDNPAYLENVKANLVGTLTSFIEMDDDTFTDPVSEISGLHLKADKLGFPIGVEELARLFGDASKSEGHKRATKLLDDQLAKSKEYLSWINAIEALVEKTKGYNKHFFIGE